MHVFSCTYLPEAVFNSKLDELVVKPTLVVYICAVFGKSSKSINVEYKVFWVLIGAITCSASIRTAIVLR